MLTSTLDAAQILGVTQRQVQHAVKTGLLTAVKLGRTLGVYEHQVFALERMDLSGRRWDQHTWSAALELLSGRSASGLDRSSRSRLKSRLRRMTDAELVGRILAGRVHLYRADMAQQRAIGSAISDEMGLIGYGTAVLTGDDVAATARQLGLTEDPEGNVVAVQAAAEHRAVIEALAFVAYGSTREESAGRKWIERQRKEVLGT